MCAIGACDGYIARTRQILLCRPRDQQEDTLHVLRQDAGAERDLLPGAVFLHLGGDASTGTCQHALEDVQVGYRRTQTFDAATNDELLIEHAERAKSGVGLCQDGAENALEPLTSLR